MARFFRGMRLLERYLLILLMLVLIFVCTAQVFFRIVLHLPLAWTEEMARYAFVWLTFIGSATVMANWGHFQVDLIIGRLHPPLSTILRYFSYICVLIYCYVMVVYGWELLEKVFRQKSAAMLIPMSIPYAALPLSGLLMLLHVVEHIIKDFRPSAPAGEVTP